MMWCKWVGWSPLSLELAYCNWDKHLVNNERERENDFKTLSNAYDFNEWMNESLFLLSDNHTFSTESPE